MSLKKWKKQIKKNRLRWKDGFPGQQLGRPEQARVGQSGFLGTGAPGPIYQTAWKLCVYIETFRYLHLWSQHLAPTSAPTWRFQETGGRIGLGGRKGGTHMEESGVLGRSKGWFICLPKNGMPFSKVPFRGLRKIFGAKIMARYFGNKNGMPFLMCHFGHLEKILVPKLWHFSKMAH